MSLIEQYFGMQGKVAIVTGASKGIGASIARFLASAGAKVVISSRKQADLDAFAEELRAQGAEVTAFAAHVGDTEQLKELVAKTIAAYGGVDILINNAAANPHYGPTLEFPKSAFAKIMEINVQASLVLTQLVHESMKSRGGGSIVNVSSIAGLTPDPGLGMYSVTKAALNMLTKVYAKELGTDGIRVNAICPGLVKTKFSQALWQDEKTLARFTRHLPIARMGTVEEIAGLALYLASPASGYCTGGIYTADGGTTI